MNEKTIRDLYFGKLYPEKSGGCKTEAYRERMKEFDHLYDVVNAALPEKERETLSLMIDAYGAAQSEDVADAFVNGFKIGMNLAVESLRDENNKMIEA